MSALQLILSKTSAEVSAGCSLFMKMSDRKPGMREEEGGRRGK
jgi:hypothetical protein